MSKHLSTSATEQELSLLADAVSQANLEDKVAQYQNQATSSFAFANGDKLTIASGFARVAKMISTEGGERKVTPYLVFDAEVLHTNGTKEPCSISIRQLVQPTIVTVDPKAALITRNQLVKRFGNVVVEYRDTRNSTGQVVTLPFLSKEQAIDIVTGKVWIPKFDSYKDGGWQSAEPKENYGYAKA